MGSMLSKSDLEKVLDLLFEDMKNAGLVTPEMENNKEGILDAVTEGLLGNDKGTELTWDEIKDENVQKKLMGAIVQTAIMGPDKDGIFLANKENNTFINELNRNSSDEKKSLNPELAKQFQLMVAFKISLDALFKNNNDPNKIADKVKEFMQPFQKELANKPDGPGKKQAENELSTFEKQLTESLSNMNGGDDPRITGEVQKIIQGPIAGNVVGWTNQSIADPKSFSALVMDITYNAGKIDPQGKENITKANDLLSGALEAVSEVVTSYANAPKNKRE